MTKACIVPNCKTGYKSNRVKRSVFKAPNDEEMRKKWAALIPGIGNLKPTQFVCERHFRADCVTRKYVKHDKNGKLIAEVPLKRPYLTAHAVPTIFIADDDESALAIEQGEMVVAEQNILGEQDDSKTMEVGTHAIAEDTKPFCDNNLSFETVDIKAPCINEFKVESENTNEMHSQSETSVERCLLIDPPISKLHVVSTGCVSDGKNIISLPETWSVTKSIAKIGTEITFCHITTTTQNDIKSLIINKFFVIENWTGRIQFYVHGRQFCTDNTPLPSIIQNVSRLREILATFNRMHICRGLGSADLSLVKTDAFQDQSNSWHYKQCTLLTKNRICDGCKTLKSAVWRRKSRAFNPRKPKRVSRISNSQNQIKFDQNENSIVEEARKSL